MFEKGREGGILRIEKVAFGSNFPISGLYCQTNVIIGNSCVNALMKCLLGVLPGGSAHVYGRRNEITSSYSYHFIVDIFEYE